jgi:hypothetical protein
MAKKKAKGVAPGAAKPISHARPFPKLTMKFDLAYRVLLHDQILLIHDFFSPTECKEFLKYIDNQLPLELTPPKKKGEADRVNHRISVVSAPFAQHLHSLLVPHLPPFPYPASAKRVQGSRSDDPRPPHSLNSNIRVYKYTPDQYFGSHYDDSVRDPETGAKSEWTLLIYLTGVEDGVLGGETYFEISEQKGYLAETITVPLTRGTALLHRHGQECLLHGGSRVLGGTKYVLRSDLMFMK